MNRNERSDQLYQDAGQRPASNLTKHLEAAEQAEPETFNVYVPRPLEDEFRGTVRAVSFEDARRLAVETGLVRRNDLLWVTRAATDPNPPQIRVRKLKRLHYDREGF